MRNKLEGDREATEGGKTNRGGSLSVYLKIKVESAKFNT